MSRIDVLNFNCRARLCKHDDDSLASVRAEKFKKYRANALRENGVSIIIDFVVK